MPTVLNFEGLRFVIYLNAHVPAHVHVIGPGWAVVVNLLGPELRSFTGSARDATRALRLVLEHQITLIAAWERLHG